MILILGQFEAGKYNIREGDPFLTEDCTAYSGYGYRLSIQASNVVVDCMGNTIEGSPYSRYPSIAIGQFDILRPVPQEVTIKNCGFLGPPASLQLHAISIGKSVGVVVENNDFFNTFVSFKGSMTPTTDGNSIRRNRFWGSDIHIDGSIFPGDKGDRIIENNFIDAPEPYPTGSILGVGRGITFFGQRGGTNENFLSTIDSIRKAFCPNGRQGNFYSRDVLESSIVDYSTLLSRGMEELEEAPCERPERSWQKLKVSS